MQTAHKPAPTVKGKVKAAIATRRARPAKRAPAGSSGSPRFAVIAMRISTELKSLAKLGCSFSSVSYHKLGRLTRIAGASQAIGSELAGALSDGVLTSREISSLTRKALAANGGLAPKKAPVRS